MMVLFIYLMVVRELGGHPAMYRVSHVLVHADESGRCCQHSHSAEVMHLVHGIVVTRTTGEGDARQRGQNRLPPGNIFQILLK